MKKEYRKPDVASEEVLEQTSLACAFSEEYPEPFDSSQGCEGVKVDNVFDGNNEQCLEQGTVVFTGETCDIVPSENLLS